MCEQQKDFTGIGQALRSDLMDAKQADRRRNDLKPWAELSIEERIERTRAQLKALIRRQDRFELEMRRRQDRFELEMRTAASIARDHSHDQFGRVAIPAASTEWALGPRHESLTASDDWF